MVLILFSLLVFLSEETKQYTDDAERRAAEVKKWRGEGRCVMSKKEMDEHHHVETSRKQRKQTGGVAARWSHADDGGGAGSGRGSSDRWEGQHE